MARIATTISKLNSREPDDLRGVPLQDSEGNMAWYIDLDLFHVEQRNPVLRRKDPNKVAEVVDWVLLYEKDIENAITDSTSVESYERIVHWKAHPKDRQKHVESRIIIDERGNMIDKPQELLNPICGPRRPHGYQLESQHTSRFNSSPSPTDVHPQRRRTYTTEPSRPPSYSKLPRDYGGGEEYGRRERRQSVSQMVSRDRIQAQYRGRHVRCDDVEDKDPSLVRAEPYEEEHEGTGGFSDPCSQQLPHPNPFLSMSPRQSNSSGRRPERQPPQSDYDHRDPARPIRGRPARISDDDDPGEPSGSRAERYRQGARPTVLVCDDERQGDGYSYRQAISRGESQRRNSTYSPHADYTRHPFYDDDDREDLHFDDSRGYQRYQW